MRLTSKNKEQERNQRAVPNVQYTPRQATQPQLRDPVDKRVSEDVECRCASCHERSPVPMVILTAEQEVYHQDGDCGACDDHETVAEEEEAEHVVDLAEPDGGHDEVELDEDGSEGEDADDEHGWDGFHVGCHGWDLAGDLVGADGGCDWWLAEADPAACERERD